MSASSQPVSIDFPPGNRKKRKRFTAKGRQVDAAALDDVRELLGDRPRRRDHLIEFLHLVQDKWGHLSAANLAALAQEMRLAQTEVYEVATFYAHFDIVREGEEAPPACTVRVCDSLSCEMSGAKNLLERLPDYLGPDVRVVRAPCMGRCDTAPVVEVGHHHVDFATPESIKSTIDAGHTHAEMPDYKDFDAYVAAGGYKLLKACLAGERERDELTQQVLDSNLRGLGGAGFPTGRKWGFVRSYDGPRLMAVNGDEGEPGTFKDRYYLERNPHQFLEGMLIAAWVVEAETVFLYMRDEYPFILDMLRAELPKVEAAGLFGGREVELRRGAGAYICGEESSMIESIEGKRGLPRHRPPYVAEVGIFGRPTLVQNIETLYWIPEIINRGVDWFTSHGRNGSTGLRTYSVSGRVKKPGVILCDAGITVRELIDEYCGGMADGHTFKAYLPGGASGGILPASIDDVPLDFGTLQAHDCFIGSHAVVVLSDQDNMRDVALNLMRFFEDESCGQCTPCRVGTEKSVKLMCQDTWNVDLLRSLSQAMTDASICGLGQAAANPLLSVLKHFPEEL
jgi:NADH:ubiquinone oxidoreductase subunit F (NADH-binding)/NADH:ubiquinone oxidoreductase subunit E